MAKDGPVATIGLNADECGSFARAFFFFDRVLVCLELLEVCMRARQNPFKIDIVN
jgi:hypothetical protein